MMLILNYEFNILYYQNLWNIMLRNKVNDWYFFHKYYY